MSWEDSVLGQIFINIANVDWCFTFMYYFTHCKALFQQFSTRSKILSLGDQVLYHPKRAAFEVERKHSEQLRWVSRCKPELSQVNRYVWSVHDKPPKETEYPRDIIIHSFTPNLPFSVYFTSVYSVAQIKTQIPHNSSPFIPCLPSPPHPLPQL